jgi:hypothetical protein
LWLSTRILIRLDKQLISIADEIAGFGGLSKRIFRIYSIAYLDETRRTVARCTPADSRDFRSVDRLYSPESRDGNGSETAELQKRVPGKKTYVCVCVYLYTCVV